LNQVSPNQILEWFRINHPNFQIKIISHKDIVFKKRNKLLCFYCGRYKNKWTCPPRIPDINYEEMFKEYENLAFVYYENEINANYDEVRENSTVNLHKVLLDAENYLFRKSNSTRISFIGGSCKLCKNGCDPDKCRNPYLARIPIEATGVDVVESAGKVGIEINFPAEKKLIRLGLLLW